MTGMIGVRWRWWLCVALLSSASCVLWACAGPADENPSVERLQADLQTIFERSGRPVDLKDSMVSRLAPPKVPWSQMGKSERERYMARSVMPVMLLFFEGYSREYQSGDQPFSCLTCHGDTFARVGNVSNFDFSRPTHLFPLDPSNIPTEFDPDPEMARMVRFMKEKITPAMRIMLGDPNVSCFTCHARK